VTTTCVESVAVTVRIEELPAVIDVELALMVTVGDEFDAEPTVTVTVAVTFPVGPVAVAVYVVVEAGLTVSVPPLAASLNELPSEPVTCTLDASVALIVKVVELPAVIEVDEAAILTVAACVVLF